MTKEESYIYGLLITDGSLYLQSRNRGRVSLEVNIKDEEILNKLCKYIPNSNIKQRIRNTNFKQNYATKIFYNYRRDFRDKLLSWGYPILNKTLNACPPKVEYSEFDFWRGVIDGDGSIGITKQNIPFISLVTKSEILKISYLEFLKKYIKIDKNINRNMRDNVYNIMITRKHAVQLSKFLYLDNTTDLYLSRKLEKGLEIQKFNY